MTAKKYTKAQMDTRTGNDMLSTKIIRLVILLALLSFVYSVLSVLVFANLYMSKAIIWNLFLAGLPLILAIIIAKTIDTNKILAVLLFIAWVLLFPNSPYMLTDLIHTSMYSYYSYSIGFLADFTSWTGFLHILIGVLLGVLYGYISLFMLQKIVIWYRGKNAGWLFVCIVSVLSSVAIYMGRFIRLNSWDVLSNPGAIIRALASLFNMDAMKIILLFTVMVSVIYIIFYFCMDDNTRHANPRANDITT